MVDVTPVTDPDSADFAACAALYEAFDAEQDPGDPPVPRAERRAKLFAPPADRPTRVFLARAGGEPVGLATAVQWRDGVNDGIVEIAAVVHPAHRRRGVGRTLVRTGLGVAAEVGATSIVGVCRVEAGEPFCRRLGLTRRLEMRISRLHVADVDEAQQRAWIDEAPARAAGYRLEGWIGVCPDDRAEALATAFDAMVDAPVDDLDYVPQPTPPHELIARERAWDRQGYDVVTALAVARDGSPAGATQILVSRLRPAIGHQADTGVAAAHRGHQLGRWLKADNLARARAHEPALAVLDTGNAQTNPHMLAINVAQGYRPYRIVRTYQAPVADVRA